MADLAPVGRRPSGGPRVVAIGGGSGLSASLAAIRSFAGTLTAVVSVADDGGSSGRLRAMRPDLPAPGDVRKCLGALADPEIALGQVLEHRFDDGPTAGHTVGNLLLAALTDELGSFSAAIDELADRIGACGRVVPATVEPVDLIGRSLDGDIEIVGQVAVQNSTGIRRVALRPAHPASDAIVAQAIAEADQVVLGPGSLFTSVLAAAVVPAVRDAIEATPAQRVLVANLAPQVPESEGLCVADEAQLLVDHGIVVDVVLTDPARSFATAPTRWTGEETPLTIGEGCCHDPGLLAGALARLLP